MEIGDRRGVANCLTALASIAGEQQRLRRAARLYGTADAVLESFDGQLIPVDRIENAPCMQAVRAEIGEDEFTRAYDEDRSMDTPEGLSYALEESEAGESET